MGTGGAEELPSAIVGTFRVDQKPVELTSELRHLQGTLINAGEVLQSAPVAVAVVV